MVKKVSFLVIFLFSLQFLHAQNATDSIGIDLQKWARLIQEDTSFTGRYEADSIFTVNLVQTLKQPYSFQFNFDSLLAVKQTTAPDSSFKFFSWQLDLGNGQYKKRGALQMNTLDGKLKLFPFFDQSNLFESPEYVMSSRKKWMGAIYYDIVQTSFNGVTYYTFLGFDEFNNTMSKKLIEVMHFENNEPVLGGNYFEYPADDTYPLAPIQRFVYTYKKGSNAYIRYDKETGKLLLSELSSISNNLKDKTTLVPSGNELYFIWREGKWKMPH